MLTPSLLPTLVPVAHIPAIVLDEKPVLPTITYFTLVTGIWMGKSEQEVEEDSAILPTTGSYLQREHQAFYKWIVMGHRYIVREILQITKPKLFFP